jgi:hypothetical protein
MDGKEAWQRGRNQADSMYQGNGIAYLREWTKSEPSNDYERGRLERAKEILKSDWKV